MTIAESAERGAAAGGDTRRAELLDQVARYCVEHGVVDLTLRRVAKAVGSNNRMLLYYFGSREEMIAAALEHAINHHSGVRVAFDSLDAELDDPPEALVADREPAVRFRLDRAWSLIADPKNLPANRLFFETVVLAVHTPGRFDAVLENVNHELSGRIAAMLVRHGADDDTAARMGREIAAEWRGLQLALLTGDTDAGPELLHHAVATRVAAGAASRERSPRS